MFENRLATNSGTINLTSTGTLDWAHWGRANATSFDHKSGVTQKISNFTKLGSGTAQWLDDGAVGYTWTGGTPTASATNSQTGLFIAGTGSGFQITVPAATTTRNLKVYVGGWNAVGKLEAILSDGSAPTYVNTGLNGGSNGADGVYTITFRAGSAGNTLTVKWTVNSGSGNVTFQSAALY